MKKQTEYYTQGEICQENDFGRIRKALNIIEPETTTIDGSCIANELYVLKKKIFEELNEPNNTVLFCSKGCYSNGNGKYFIADCTPVFEQIYYPYDGGYRSKYRASETSNIVELNLETLLSTIEVSEETLTTIYKEIEEYDEKKNIYYEVKVKENKQSFYLQDDLVNGCIGFEIEKNDGDWLNGSRHKISINLNGYELNFDCLLKNLNEKIETLYLQHNIDFALKNTIAKIENGYIFNNVYYEELEDIAYFLKNKGVE